MAAHKPRLLLADDHAEARELLNELLEPEFDVVAQVEDGRALVEAAEEFSPDVIVSDISMAGRLDGIAAARAIRRKNPTARVVFVTVHNELLLLERGLATGALGYVLKGAAGDELISAVQAALRGDQYVSLALRGQEDTTPAGGAENAPHDTNQWAFRRGSHGSH